jgi:hypothetical protein
LSIGRNLRGGRIATIAPPEILENLGYEFFER